jgi:glycosyltransferase involved in cell wall biosynthesis
MRILWIVNTIFPAPSNVLGFDGPVIGGWMYGMAGRIATTEGCELAVATVYKGSELKMLKIDNIDYYLLPCKDNVKYDYRLENYWEIVCNQFKPDIVHIHGTEFAHGLACLRRFSDLKYVVSIQGLVSICAKYYLGGLSIWDVVQNITFRDIIRNNNLFQARREFKKRGKLEIEYLIRSKHVIGRTKWDFVFSRKDNLGMEYHFCNESLRNSFYTAEKWDINKKRDFSIFCSQCTYPIKGVHQVLKAVALLKKDFPEIKLKIAGGNIIRRDTILDKIKISGYGKYLNGLIKELDISEFVEFTGELSENEMIKCYQEAHLFICSSIIENSPNSLGEAQLIGVPSIASFVGGVPDMIEDGKSGMMYRFEDFEILANQIRTIFCDSGKAQYLSFNGILSAKMRHDQELNLKKTLEIYDHIYAAQL